MARLARESSWRFDLDFRGALLGSDGVWVDDVRLDECDGLFWYCEIDRRPGSHAQQVLTSLADVIPVAPDPGRWRRAVDKYHAHLTLRRAGLPVPDFALFELEQLGRAVELVERWGACVLKPRLGAWGHGVTFVERPETLRDLCHYNAARGVAGGFFIERFYPNDIERWISVTTLGGEPMFGYRKDPSLRGSFGPGVKVFDEDQVGGRVEYVELDTALRELAREAAAALGVPVVGFDMIWTADGPVIVDENTSPAQYPALFEAAGRDPGEEWARTIRAALGRRG